jgi:hypothetical protein
MSVHILKFLFNTFKKFIRNYPLHSIHAVHAIMTNLV